jgi:hypothetical protein
MLNSFLLLGITFAAENRTALGRLKGHLSFCAAFSAGNGVHLSGAAIIGAAARTAASYPASGATTGIIL